MVLKVFICPTKKEKTQTDEVLLTNRFVEFTHELIPVTVTWATKHLNFSDFMVSANVLLTFCENMDI